MEFRIEYQNSISTIIMIFLFQLDVINGNGFGILYVQ